MHRLLFHITLLYLGGAPHTFAVLSIRSCQLLVPRTISRAWQFYVSV